MLPPCDRSTPLGISKSFDLLSLSWGLVICVLLTRSPLTHTPKGTRPFDLHVLSTPPAFVLSQDQTLRWKFDLTLTFDSWLFHWLDIISSIQKSFLTALILSQLVRTSGIQCSVFKVPLTWALRCRGAAQRISLHKIPHLSTFVNTFFYFFIKNL